MTLPKIKHVRAWFIGGATAEQGAGGGDYHDQGANHWIDDHIATPMSKYTQYEQSRQSFGINVLGTLIVEVEADNGQTGFAVSTAGEMGCFIVEKHLNRFIEGKCVSDIKLIHDQMLNATLYYAGSGGLVMNTISCVDLALWDLFGKVVGLPVYKLLGGAVRDEIQFYATGLNGTRSPYGACRNGYLADYPSGGSRHPADRTARPAPAAGSPRRRWR